MTAGSCAKALGHVVVVEQASDSHLPSTPVGTGRHCTGYRRSLSATFHPARYSFESMLLAFRNFGIRLDEIIETVSTGIWHFTPPHPLQILDDQPGLDTLVTNVNPSEFLDLVRIAGKTLPCAHGPQVWKASTLLEAVSPQRFL